MADNRYARDLNWGYINKIIKDTGKSEKDINLSLGRSKSYISMCRKNDSIDDTVLRLFCVMYNADYDTCITKASANVETSTAMTEVLADILAKIGELAIQLDTVKARLDRPADPTDFNLLSNKDKATVLLKAMQYDNGAVDTIDYENKLKEFNIPYECIKQAMAATSSQFITKQYGNKKIKWIVVI